MAKWYSENQFTRLDFSLSYLQNERLRCAFLYSPSSSYNILLLFLYTFFSTSYPQVDEVLMYHVDTIWASCLDVHFSNFTLTVWNAWKRTLMHCSENPSYNQRCLRILVSLFSEMVQLNLFKKKSLVTRRAKMWYTQLGSELTGFIDDAFCYGLFKVK